MGLPKLVYGVGLTVLQFVRGPKDFRCSYKAVVHDNVATSGIRERVCERNEILLEFTMPALTVGDDFDEWDAFQAFAMAGGQFDFYPNLDVNYHFHVVDDGEGWSPVRVGPRVYSASFAWRVVPDGLAPANVADVMEAFYGV